MAALTAAGLVFSAGPASAVTHGSERVSKFSGGCVGKLYYNSSTKWAYARAEMYSYHWTCKAFVKNSHGTKSWTSRSTDSWSGGVWRPAGYKAQVCVYSYYYGTYKGWSCTSWY